MQLLRSFLLLRLFPVLLVCCLLLGGHARPGASVVAGVLVWKTSICRRSNHTSTLRVEPLVRASNPYIRGRLAEAVFIIECILYIYIISFCILWIRSLAIIRRIRLTFISCSSPALRHQEKAQVWNDCKGLPSPFSRSRHVSCMIFHLQRPSLREELAYTGVCSRQWTANRRLLKIDYQYIVVTTSKIVTTKAHIERP